jgi:hypothetical protein
MELSIKLILLNTTSLMDLLMYCHNINKLHAVRKHKLVDTLIVKILVTCTIFQNIFLKN